MTTVLSLIIGAAFFTVGLVSFLAGAYDIAAPFSLGASVCVMFYTSFSLNGAARTLHNASNVLDKMREDVLVRDERIKALQALVLSYQQDNNVDYEEQQ
jgi:hypothetical protein